MPKVKVAASSVAAQVLAFRQLNEWKDGPRGGQESVVLPRSCSSIEPVRRVLKGSRKRRSERYDEELSSDDSCENYLSEVAVAGIEHRENSASYDAARDLETD